MANKPFAASSLERRRMLSVLSAAVQALGIRKNHSSIEQAA